MHWWERDGPNAEPLVFGSDLCVLSSCLTSALKQISIYCRFHLIQTRAVRLIEIESRFETLRFANLKACDVDAVLLCSRAYAWLPALSGSLKAKVYFTFYAYARDSVQCAWCELRHQNSTRILYAHHPIFVTARTLYAQVAHAHWSYFAVIRFSHMVATLFRAVVSQ